MRPGVGINGLPAAEFASKMNSRNSRVVYG
jgi:hypothetical protein